MCIGLQPNCGLIPLQGKDLYCSTIDVIATNGSLLRALPLFHQVMLAVFQKKQNYSGIQWQKASTTSSVRDQKKRRDNMPMGFEEDMLIFFLNYVLATGSHIWWFWTPTLMTFIWEVPCIFFSKASAYKKLWLEDKCKRAQFGTGDLWFKMSAQIWLLDSQ